MRLRGPSLAPRAILVAIALTGIVSNVRAETGPPPFTSYPASMHEVLERFPTRGANRSALELEKIAASIGIDLVPVPRRDREGRPEEAKRAFEEAKPALLDYLFSQLARPDAGVGVPPPSVAAFLRGQEESLAALRSRLALGDLPTWERDLEKLREAPIPNLLGHINLQRLLLTDALVRASRGDEFGALADLEASWTLNAAIREEPTLITQLIAVAVVRMQAGTLRRLRVVPPEWRLRLFEHDYRDSVMNALWLEGWMWKQPGSWSLPQGEGLHMKIGEWLSRPYVRLCGSDASTRWERHLAELSAVAALCDADLGRYEERLVDSIPWWNRLATHTTGSLLHSLDRVARLELDLELTERILSRKGTPRPPGRRLEPSRACPSLRWIDEAREDSTFSIALDGERTWPGQTGLILPNRYEETPTGP